MKEYTYFEFIAKFYPNYYKMKYIDKLTDNEILKNIKKGINDE